MNLRTSLPTFGFYWDVAIQRLTPRDMLPWMSKTVAFQTKKHGRCL